MKVALYGIGKNFMQFDKLNDYLPYLVVVGAYDNDSLKWGQTFRGFTVENPEALTKKDYDYVIVFPDKYEEVSEFLNTKYAVPVKKMMHSYELIVPKVGNIGTLSFNHNYDEIYDIRDIISDIVPSNRLEQFAFQKKHRLMTKWLHYFEIYETHFSKYCEKKNVTMLEIGTFKGGSLQMWKDYLGSDAVIVGIDIDPDCKAFEEDNIHICIGSQNDPAFLQDVVEKYGPFDIILDDGSHEMEHQITSFETLFRTVKDGGIYAVEDLHTSYWEGYDGGYKKSGTFIEYSKNFIDYINKQHIHEAVDFPEYGDYIKACHYYDSILVIDKKFRGLSHSVVLSEK
jgi:predicted O-methyltransferase YrrM